MYKNDQYYLEKMKENVDFILEHMNGVSKEQLESDPVLQDSMMLREEFREQNPYIPWTDIYDIEFHETPLNIWSSIRLKARHRYFRRIVPMRCLCRRFVPHDP